MGGDVGASRPLVDEGWVSRNEQMGINGKKVTPGLYVAVGISGTFQHLAALQEAEYVIVINTDRNAPFFMRADFGIEGDYREVLPALLQVLKDSMYGRVLVYEQIKKDKKREISC